MIKPLTSLRFLFALMVFLSHLQFFSPDDKFFRELHYQVIGEGYIGVSFFFILSGFILSLNYDQRLLSKKTSFSEFWMARIARIYPLHIVGIMLAIPLALDDFSADPPFTMIKLLSSAALIHSFIPDGAYFFAFNSPSWSLSDEMFFYFMFPFIVFAMVRTKFLIRFGWLIFLLIPWGMSLTPAEDEFHKFFYVNPFFRIVDFMLGITLHQLYTKRIFSGLHRSKAVATVCELLAVAAFGVAFYFHNSIPQEYRWSCYYWVPMALIIFVFAYQNGLLSKLISNKFCVLLGEISFSFYLVHQLAIRYVEQLNGVYSLFSSNYVMAAVMFLVSLIASYILHKGIEIPLNTIIKNKYKSFSAPVPVAANDKVPVY